MLAPRRRAHGLEVVFVALVALGVMIPGIWSYTLVDPWETHYGEVSRRMLADHDWVHTQWQDEGFRSKPVLTFWIEAASLTAFRVASNGGYSGELVEAGPRTMFAIRLPFVLFAVMGLCVMWWMLARLVSRRVAWLALLVVGSCPFYCLVAREAIPDMPLVACMTGAMAMFTMAVEDGDGPCEPMWWPKLPGIRRFELDARHLLWLVAGGSVVVQAVYYAYLFSAHPGLADRIRFPGVNLILPLIMLAVLATQARDGWRLVRAIALPLGGIAVIAFAALTPLPLAIGARIAIIVVGAAVLGVATFALLTARPPPRTPGTTAWRRLCDDLVPAYDRRSPDRYAIRGLAFIVVWTNGGKWVDTNPIADKLLAIEPITTRRQVYLLWCYTLLGVSVLAKGPPALGIVGIVGVFYVVLLARWRPLYDGAFEIKRGILLMLVIFIPWHFAMYLKDGVQFIAEYIGQHLLNRAGDGSVDNSPGTFEYYTLQLGYGMWIWAALLPAAIVGLILRARSDSREGRVRFIVALWIIVTIAFFSLVQTKFHHYILPVVPALGIAIAMFLDDSLAGRDRLHPLLAALGIGIVLLIGRDLMHAPQRWIELFVFRYDRPWPAAEPWSIDPSAGFLALAVIAAIALAFLGSRFVRLGVCAVSAAALAICVWSLQAYMPVAARHWGMREAVRTYYQQRNIYGETLVYFGGRELYDAWHDIGDSWTFESYIPDALQIGQPMSLHVRVNRAEDERISVSTQDVVGKVSAIGPHSITITMPHSERAKLDPMIAAGKAQGRGRSPIAAVDADRIFAWQLYWRGEAFWTGDEIWGWLPEMKTSGPIDTKTDNVDFLKYLNDRTKAPIGRRYFVLTEAGRATGAKGLIPTQRGRDSYEVLDTTSNKFSLAAFWL